MKLTSKKIIAFLYLIFFSPCLLSDVLIDAHQEKNKIKQLDDASQHHVICSYTQQPSSQEQRDELNQKVHKATYKIKQYCKNNFDQPLDTNETYQHRQDSVFIINIHYDHGSWTLYKPSFICYEDFVTQAEKIYKEYGLDVICEKEVPIKILAMPSGFDGEYLTLKDFETYKKQTDEEIQKKIESLKKEVSEKNDVTAEIAQLKKIQDMNDYFFWHLQIPTTGLLASEQYDALGIEYRPVAWNFLLWDLAPKKGKGAQVAIIDTGTSAFDIKEPEFSGLYKKNVNITSSCDLQSYGYNLVSENGLDPIRQIAINFGHYCDHKKFDIDALMQKLPIWIKNYIKNEDKSQIEQYFIKHTKKSSLDESGTKLNKRGERFLEDLLHGKYGIAPKGSKSFFTVINLDKPYSQNALLETLPAPKIIGNKDTFAAGHGTFTQGIINAQHYNSQGIVGIAPDAHVTMIKAFHDSGTTNKTTLNAALERAITLKSSIVSMSLKITDTISETQDATLKKLIDSIDYVVAASGNDGDDPALKNKEAYPAKFESVAFDVGAFKYDDGNYSICSFTQKELNIGPKFLAPGYDLFSSTLTPGQTSDSMYAFMSGTSVAVPVVTGFLALALAEFQHDFTREEILKVIYKFSIKLHKNWDQDVILGTIDMRSSLLCLHTLKALQTKLTKKKSALDYSYAENFDNLVQAIYTINYYPTQWYEKKSGYSFVQDFAHYNKAAQAEIKNSEKNQTGLCRPVKNKSAHANLNSVVTCMVDTIISVLTTKSAEKTSMKNTPQDLSDSLSTILSTQNINIFDQASAPCITRINAGLAPKKK